MKANAENTSGNGIKQGTPPILRRGNRRRGRTHSSSYDATGFVFQMFFEKSNNELTNFDNFQRMARYL
jgi:hypothetical protein